MTKMSIIIPLYKTEKYIHKCIESVIMQTLKDIEIILVDDGSPDKCGVIAEKYKIKDPRIKVIHKENGGLSSARNAGLRVASGEYVGFVDSDDWIEPQMFKVMYEMAQENNADISICNYNRVYEKHMKRNSLIIHDEVIELNKIGLSEYFYQYLFQYVHGNEACNKIYKKTVLDKHKIQFERNTEIFSEDLLFNLYFLCHTEKICSINRAFYNYLQRDSSIMYSPRPKLLIQYTNLVVKFIKYAEKSKRLKEINNIPPILLYILLKGALGYYLDHEHNTKTITETLKDVSKSPNFILLMKRLAISKSATVYCSKTGQGIKSNLLMRIYAFLCVYGFFKFFVGILKFEYYISNKKKKL